jgi:hypothetical protein
VTIHAVPFTKAGRAVVVGGSGRRHAIRNPRGIRRRSSFWVDSRTGGTRQGRSSGAWCGRVGYAASQEQGWRGLSGSAGGDQLKRARSRHRIAPGRLLVSRSVRVNGSSGGKKARQPKRLSWAVPEVPNLMQPSKITWYGGGTRSTHRWVGQGQGVDDVSSRAGSWMPNSAANPLRASVAGWEADVAVAVGVLEGRSRHVCDGCLQVGGGERWIVGEGRDQDTVGGRTGLRLRTVGVVRACLPKSNSTNRGKGRERDGMVMRRILPSTSCAAPLTSVTCHTGTSLDRSYSWDGPCLAPS